MTSSSPETLVVPSVPRSVAEVRRFAVASCADCPTDVCDTVALLVSEVATNALVHGAGDVEVRVVRVGHRLRIEVSDGSPELPRPRRVGPDAEGGRGLALVDALAADWGTATSATGKVVWFEVAV